MASCRTFLRGQRPGRVSAALGREGAGGRAGPELVAPPGLVLALLCGGHGCEMEVKPKANFLGQKEEALQRFQTLIKPSQAA